MVLCEIIRVLKLLKKRRACDQIFVKRSGWLWALMGPSVRWPFQGKRLFYLLLPSYDTRQDVMYKTCCIWIKVSLVTNWFEEVAWSSISFLKKTRTIVTFCLFVIEGMIICPIYAYLIYGWACSRWSFCGNEFALLKNIIQIIKKWSLYLWRFQYKSSITPQLDQRGYYSNLAFGVFTLKRRIFGFESTISRTWPINTF